MKNGSHVSIMFPFCILQSPFLMDHYLGLRHVRIAQIRVARGYLTLRLKFTSKSTGIVTMRVEPKKATSALSDLWLPAI
jgi:hypothetical protein